MTILNDVSVSLYTNLRVSIFAYNRAKIIYHPQRNPSHFERKNIIVFKKVGKVYIRINKFESTLLPSPYQSNCQDYSDEQKNSYKSQIDCKLEYMRRKELEICGKNYYWIQNKYEYKYLNEIHFERTIKPECQLFL